MSQESDISIDLESLVRFFRTDGFIYLCIVGFIVMFCQIYSMHQDVLAYRAAYEACDPAVICGRAPTFPQSLQ